VLVQIVEANGTLQPIHDSRKSDEADGVVVVTASRWQDLLVFLLLLVLLDCSFSAASFSVASFLQKMPSLLFKALLCLE
jgi:hypothetical protein